jgi:K+-transporting ATPase KdpF subunit
MTAIQALALAVSVVMLLYLLLALLRPEKLQ